MRAVFSGVTAVAVLLSLCRLSGALYAANGPVVSLDPSNFKSKLKSGGAWVVEFYAPWCGHCQQLKPVWEQAAAALQGIVNVAAVDANEHQQLAGEYQIKGFPTIKFMYADASGSIKAVEYRGGRSAKDIIEFAMDKAKALALKRIGQKPSAGGGARASGGAGAEGGGGDGGFYSGTDVVTLTDANFNEQVLQSKDLWMIEFYAPWCGHCKNLKPAWIDAAGTLAGKVKLGAVDCTAHQGTCGQYQVQGYPTLKYFGANKRSPQDYQGGRDSGSIVDFASKKWSASQPPPEVLELTSQKVLEDGCTQTGKQLCFVAFLPNILDSGASGRKAYISALQKVADGYKDKQWGYFWVEGTKQPKLEHNFAVGGYGYPALVAFKPKDALFTTSKSAFATDAIKEWVESIRKGATSVLPISGTLATLETHAAWDGQDAKVELEDEFSLEDILGEEL